MHIIRTAEELHQVAARLGRTSGLGGVLVPTMGALHAGHAALIECARDYASHHDIAEGCIVSIFVNPTQFNDPADLARYPRTPEEDEAVCQRAGAKIVFAPDPETIYPPPPAPAIQTPTLPDVALLPGLEDAFRPGHFAGVCQVVQRLFDLLEPRVALFGEKDWQQLQVIRSMTANSHLPVQIASLSTVRDPDGLAMSSRNRFLSPQERKAAQAIPQALEAAGREITAAKAEEAMRQILEKAGLQIEYAVIRDEETLGPLTTSRPGRALVAARAGRTRLIDNAAWPRSQSTQAAHSNSRS